MYERVDQMAYRQIDKADKRIWLALTVVQA